MTSSTGGESIVIPCSSKLEKFLEHKEVGNDILRTKDHFEGYHLVNNIRCENLDDATISTEYLVLNVNDRQTKTGIKHLHVKPDFPIRRKGEQRTRAREFHAIIRMEPIHVMKILKLFTSMNDPRMTRHFLIGLEEYENKEDKMRKDKGGKHGMLGI